MKKLQKISKLLGLVLLLVTVVFSLYTKLTNGPLFDAYIEYFFRVITPLNVLVVLTLVTLIFGNWSSAKETFRKSIVTLKRQPHLIPMVILAVSFVYYSFNLTKVSNTTALVYGKGMGLCQFVIMLFSVLSLVCMLNSFPKRKKPNYPMIGVMFLMLGINIYAASHYRSCIFDAVTRTESPIDITRSPYVAEAYSLLQGYIVLVVIAIALVCLMPIYSRLLKKINTSVNIEFSDNMGEIEISE